MVQAVENSVQKANEQFRLGQYQAAIELYRKALSSNLLPKKMIDFNIRLCEQRLAKAGQQALDDKTLLQLDQPKAVASAKVIRPPVVQVPAVPKAPPPVTVTLTTIASRLSKIKPVLESLHKQTVLPKKIMLNISKSPYLLDDGVTEDNEHLLELKKLSLVEVNWVENIGPYRKIFPFLEQHFSNTLTQDKLFITVDDDTLYPDYFIETLVKEYEKHDCVIAFRGRHMEVTDNRVAAYGTWQIGRDVSTMNNLPTGKDGILYSTKFFTKDFLSLKDALDLAPTADDLWIRWHCGANGVPAVILNPEACTSDYKSFPVVDYSKEYRSVSLYATHNSASSKGKNDIAIERLEQFYMEKFGYNLGMLINNAIGGSVA